MALPSSGALAITNIQTEFGGSNPAGMSEYYAGGSYVPAGTSGDNGAIPSSGTIQISDFYGAPYDWRSSQFTTRSASASTSLLIAAARAYVYVYSDGYYRVYTYDGNSSYNEYKWHVDAPGSFGSWTCTYVNSTGTVNYTNLTQSSWGALSTARYAGVDAYPYGTLKEADFYIYVKDPDDNQEYALMQMSAYWGS